MKKRQNQHQTVAGIATGAKHKHKTTTNTPHPVSTNAECSSENGSSQNGYELYRCPSKDVPDCNRTFAVYLQLFPHSPDTNFLTRLSTNECAHTLHTLRVSHSKSRAGFFANRIRTGACHSANLCHDSALPMKRATASLTWTTVRCTPYQCWFLQHRCRRLANHTDGEHLC